jgi:hypothetical protein
MHPFEIYLQQHHLDALRVSVAAQVRYVTVWYATRGHPIKLEQAHKIRRAVVSLTTVPYNGPFALTEPEPVDQWPTLPIRKLPRPNLI